MDLSRYGPFANVVTLASALLATFSVLLLKALGTVKRWSWLATGSPPFMITAAARALAVALMAVTYVTISRSNYPWFGAAAILSGVFTFVLIARFDRMRERHVVQVPLVGKDGAPLLDRRQHPLQQNIVIGLESNMRSEAAAALAEARKAKGGLSLRGFMSGYGAQHVNDPEAIWDSGLLANTRSNLTIALMCIVLFGVMAVFWSAFTIEAASRSKHTVLKFQDTGDAGIDAVQQSLNQLTSGPSDPPDQSVLDAIAPLFTRAAFFPYPTGDPRRQLYVICRVRIILEDIVPLIKDKDKSERVQEAIKLLGGMQVDVSQAFPGFDVTGNIHDHVGNEDAFLDAFNNTKVVVWDKTEFFNRLDRLVKVLSPITKIPADFADR